MPVYLNRCKDCEHIFESEQRIIEDPLRFCPVCGKDALGRVPQIPAISFVGSGFYTNDK
jgi:putative FmdB family regulatory protein